MIIFHLRYFFFKIKTMSDRIIKVIIAGGRDFDNWYLAKDRIAFFLKNIKGKIEIVSGRCSTGTPTFKTDDGIRVFGADGLGERYAKENNIPVKPFPADWNKYGARAGGIRNEEMAKYAEGDYLISFWDGMSRGTESMIKLAKRYDIKTRVVNYIK